jgi:hypothetical protein
MENYKLIFLVEKVEKGQMVKMDNKVLVEKMHHYLKITGKNNLKFKIMKYMEDS